jgi:hypothetical protein
MKIEVSVAVATFVSSIILLSLEQYIMGVILLGVSLRHFYKLKQQ